MHENHFINFFYIKLFQFVRKEIKYDFKQGFLCDINIKRKTPLRIGKIYVHVIRLENLF